MAVVKIKYDTRNGKGCPQCGSLNIIAKKKLFSREQYMKCNKCRYEWFPREYKKR